MKKIITFFLFLLSTVLLFSCADQATKPPSAGETTVNTTAPADTEVPPIVDPPAKRGIEVVNYPDGSRVSYYAELTDDQKLAFDAIMDALQDILKNGLNTEKTYTLSKTVEWLDYKTAFNLVWSSFPAADDILFALQTDGDVTQDTVENLSLYAGELKKLTESYRQYCEASRLADEALGEIECDGTPYGKAEAIAKWLCDHVEYAMDYEDRGTENFTSPYDVLTNGEAICDGYSKTYDLLCKKAGLETAYIVSSTEWHAWNMIHIGENWYHVDVTWMDSESDTAYSYKYFMMPDLICRDLEYHGGECQYYWDQKRNIIVMPQADAVDLYPYAFSDIDEMNASLAKENSPDLSFPVIIYGQPEDEALAADGTELTLQNGKKYELQFTHEHDTVYRVYLTEFREMVEITGEIRYTVTSALRDFDYEKEEKGNFVTFYTTVPAGYYYDSTDMDNAQFFYRYDRNFESYIPGITMEKAFRVDADFVMDETVFFEKGQYVARITLDEVSVMSGETETGLPYMVFEYKDSADYMAQTYVRLTDEIIIKIMLWDDHANRDALLQMIEQIHI